MRSKVVRLLAAGLLTAPVVANAGFIVTSNTATEFSGTFSFQGTSEEEIFNIAKGTQGLLPQISDPNAACTSFVGGRNYGGDAADQTRQAYVFPGCPGTPDHPGLRLQLAVGPLAFSPAGGSYENSAMGTVHWLYSDLADEGGADGRFSGAFCFSTDQTVCAPVAVPEPVTLALLGIGLAGLATARRRMR